MEFPSPGCPRPGHDENCDERTIERIDRELAVPVGSGVIGPEAPVLHDVAFNLFRKRRIYLILKEK